MADRKGKPGVGEPATLVMKFGGTSVGSVDAVRQVVGVVREVQEDWPQLVLVVSALAGVTNRLEEATRAAKRGDLEDNQRLVAELLERHTAMTEQLVPAPRRKNLDRRIANLVAEFSQLCQAIAVLGEATPRALDTAASFGERLSVEIVAEALHQSGVAASPVDSRGLIVTDRIFQSAHPDLDATRISTRKALFPLLEAGTLPVVTGFLAATPEGLTTTLGRGGSDYSAAILGAVLPAREVWIWTDVDGIMTADPRLVPEATTLPTLSYHEVAELAYFGARVLHPKTIRPIMDAGIDLRIRNTFNPQEQGTRVVASADEEANGLVKAVTAIRGQSLVTIEGRGMLGVPGVAARAFGAVAETGTSVILITQASSEQSICFAVPEEKALKVIQALEATFVTELANRDIDRVSGSDEVVIVTAVGAGMRQTPGVAGRVFTALGEAGVNVIAIAQGSSEAAISMVVAGQEAERAVTALHGLTAL